MKITYISWQPYCSRSDNTARELGGKSYTIYYDVFGSHYLTIIFKYFFQTIKTLQVLLKERPDVVFVMSPPLFACLPVFLYTKFFRKRYVIDAHTGAFKDNMWQRVMFLQRFFCRKAEFTIVTNDELSKIVSGWNADYVIVPDVPIKLHNPVMPELKNRLNITLVNTFAKDEPLDAFLDAAGRMGDIQFFITGKIKKSKSELVESAPQNVTFTDFLSYPDYYGLLLKSTAIVVLTTRDLTMQRGAYEAIYLGRPVITSDWPILRQNFAKGAVFTDNSAAGIKEAIQEALALIKALETEAEELRQLKLKRWEQNQKKILEALKS